MAPSTVLGKRGAQEYDPFFGMSPQFYPKAPQADMQSDYDGFLSLPPPVLQQPASPQEPSLLDQFQRLPPIHNYKHATAQKQSQQYAPGTLNAYRMFPQSPPQDNVENMEDAGEKRRKFDMSQQFHVIPSLGVPGVSVHGEPVYAQPFMPYAQPAKPQPSQYAVSAHPNPQPMRSYRVHVESLPKREVTMLEYMQRFIASAKAPDLRRRHEPEPAVPSLRPPRPETVELPLVVEENSMTTEDREGRISVNAAGCVYASRYRLTRELGSGTFGNVWEAHDMVTNSVCAVKIIKSSRKYREAAKMELRVLSLLGSYDPRGVTGCVKMRECFDCRNHVSIVTEVLDVNLYDFMRWNWLNPFPGRQIQQFARQILHSVAHLHALGIVHTDLKPENVMLRDSSCTPIQYGRNTNLRDLMPRRADVRRESPSEVHVLHNTDIAVIDFGSAVFEEGYHPSIVSTRHYRAPEVILGVGWSFPCDVWSIGCLLVELCTGRVLFNTRDDLQHLHMIERALGKRFSSSYLKSCMDYGKKNFILSGWVTRLAPMTTESSFNMEPIRELVYNAMDQSKDYELGKNKPFWDLFLDLIDRLMTIDPDKRITAREALKHPWLSA